MAGALSAASRRKDHGTPPGAWRGDDGRVTGTGVSVSGGRLSIWAFCLLVIGGALLGTAGPVRADEMAVVFDRLMLNPSDPSLNMRYAELAVGRGEPRKALAAYERVLASHPGHPEVLRAYKRLKHGLQPAVTEVTVETGVSYATNPRQAPDGSPYKEDDVTFDATLALFDERAIGSRRWRTHAFGRAQIQGDLEEISDVVGTVVTGPVFDLGKDTRLHVAPGVGGGWVDDDWLYRDLLVRFTLEKLFNGITQSLAVTVSDRDVNSDFNGSDGLLAEISGRWLFSDTLRKGDALFFLPRVVISRSDGDGPGRVFRNDIYVGNFVETGARAVYYTRVADGRAWLGGGLGVYWRDYDQNVANAINDREDVLIEPTAHLLIPGIFDSKFDFRIDYRFEHNDSNDPTEDFDNHVFGIRTVRKF